jgi:acetolactate synthase-1/2/3 large subunit
LNGAEILVETLLANGVDVCFANPGTSEMHFVAALDRDKPARMRCVLGLFEGVVTGAADGYFRMRERPAATLLHLGPGLGNGLANLHNARKARSGIVNIVGEHVTTHRRFDPPLAADIEGIARPVSGWVTTAQDAASIAPLAAQAISAALGPPPGIATLILPGDAAWGEASYTLAKATTQALKPVTSDAIEKAARVLASGEPCLLVLGGPALKGPALDFAGQIAGRTGCRIAAQFFSTRMERGVGRVPLERIPYAVDLALAMLKPFRHIITVDTGEPIAFFAYPGKPSRMKPDQCDVSALCERGEDALQALSDLAAAVGARRGDRVTQQSVARERPSGPINPETLARALLATIPEGCILVDESISTGRESFGVTAGAAPHDVLQNMGGSIGFGTPASTGAAIACRDRPVLCIVGDGSAMYTVQSLWTQARENLNVTTIVCANRSYQILKNEFKAVGAGALGANALSMFDIDKPALDFGALAKGMGVGAAKVTAADELCREIERGLAEPGPHVIEALL